jgi:hypothetical protein
MYPRKDHLRLFLLLLANTRMEMKPPRLANTRMEMKPKDL